MRGFVRNKKILQLTQQKVNVLLRIINVGTHTQAITPDANEDIFFAKLSAQVLHTGAGGSLGADHVSRSEMLGNDFEIQFF